MPRPITAIIHHDALQHNLDIARKNMPHSKVFAVVKASAYGHGIERVYQAAFTLDPGQFLCHQQIPADCAEKTFPYWH